MNTIQTVFHRPSVFLPVIHADTLAQVFKNVEIAIESGVDGIFLINQGAMRSRDVLQAASDIGVRHPDLWVGVNLLGFSSVEALRTIRGMSIRGLWCDDAGNLEAFASERADW